MSIDTNIEGDPASIWGVADWVRNTLGEAITSAVDDLHRVRNDASSGWRGEACDAFREKMGEGAKQGDGFADTVQRFARRFDDVGGDLKRAHTEMAGIREAAAAAGLSVADTAIQPPGAAPPSAGPAPTGEAATPAAAQAHANAVAAQQAHARQVEAYNKAKQDAEDVWRRWRSSVEELNQEQNDGAKNAWCAATDIAQSTVISSVAGNVSKFWNDSANTFFSEADKAQKHVNAVHNKYTGVVTDRRVFEEQRARAADQRAKGQSAQQRAKAAQTKGARAVKVGGGLLSIGSFAYEVSQGKDWKQAAASNAAGFGAAVATGALIGAVIGGPVGAPLGAAVGAVAGIFTSGMVDSLWENGISDVRGALSDGADAVIDTGKAILNGAEALGEAAVSGVKDAWNAIF